MSDIFALFYQFELTTQNKMYKRKTNKKKKTNNENKEAFSPHIRKACIRKFIHSNCRKHLSKAFYEQYCHEKGRKKKGV